MKSFGFLWEELLKEEEVKVQDIKDAITNKKVIEIYYNGDTDYSAKGQREIYPHLLGNTIGGNLAIRAYQPKGSTATYVPEWKIFRIDRIARWRDLSQNFEIAPKYNPLGDKMFNQIFIKL